MNFKKLFASVTTFVMFAGMAMPVMAALPGATTLDVDTLFASMQRWGMVAESFSSASEANPYNSFTRQQASVQVVKFAKIFGTDAATINGCDTAFSDINDAADYAVNGGWIENACAYGILGVNGQTQTPRSTFDPLGSFTLGQTLVAMYKTIKSGAEAPGAAGDHFARKFADALVTDGYLNDANFTVAELDTALTRVQMWNYMDEVLTNAEAKGEVTADGDDLCETAPEIAAILDLDCDDDTTTTPDPTPVGNEGTLTVGVASDSPAGGNVPAVGDNLRMGRFAFTASTDAAVTLNEINVAAGANFVNASSFDNVFFRDANGVVISNTRPLDSNRNAQLVIQGGLDIAAGQTVFLDLYADTVGSAGSQYQLEINSVASVGSTAKSVVGTFPAQTNEFNAIAYNAQDFTINILGGALSQVTVGDTSREVLRFQVTAGSNNNNDMEMLSLQLENSDPISTVMDNFVLRNGGQALSDVTFSVNNDVLVIGFTDSFVVQEGETETFYLDADIIGGEVPDFVQFTLKETSDLVTREATSRASGNVVSGGSLVGTKYDIQEGDSILLEHSSNPINYDAVANSNNNEAGVFTLSLNSEISFEEIIVSLETYDNLNGAVVPSSMIDRLTLKAEFPDGTMSSEVEGVLKDNGTPTNYTDDYYEIPFFRTLKKGITKFSVEIDFLQGVQEGYYVNNITMDGNGSFPGAEFVASQNDLQAGDIAGTVNGPKITIATPYLNLAKADSFSGNDKVIAGGEVFVGAISLNATVLDMNINNFDLLLSAALTPSDIAYLKVVFEDGSSHLENVNGSTVNFTNIQQTILKNETEVMDIYAFFNSNYNNTAGFDLAGIDAESIQPDGTTTIVPTSAMTSPAFSTSLLNVVAGAQYLEVDLATNTPATTTFVIGTNEYKEIARYDVKQEFDSAAINHIMFETTQSAYDLALNFQLFIDDGTTEKQIGGTASVLDENSVLYVLFSANSSQQANKDNVMLPDTDYDLVVKMAGPNTVIDDITKTNRVVNVQPVQSVTGVTTDSEIVSVSNNEEITSNFFSLSPAASNDQYVRKTNLNITNFAADQTQVKFDVCTVNGNGAALHQFPLEFIAVDGGSLNIDLDENAVEVNSQVQPVAISADNFNANTVTHVEFTNVIDIPSSGCTSIRVPMTLTNGAGDVVSVKIPDVDTAYSSTAQGGVTATSLGDTNGIVWSDKADGGAITTAIANWFSDADVARNGTSKLPTNLIELVNNS